MQSVAVACLNYLKRILDLQVFYRILVFYNKRSRGLHLTDLRKRMPETCRQYSIEFYNKMTYFDVVS